MSKFLKVLPYNVDVKPPDPVTDFTPIETSVRAF